jgi:hypothetical protein
MIETIDMTPTFRAVADMLIAIFEARTPEAQDFAKEELRSWGSMLDGVVAARKGVNE